MNKLARLIVLFCATVSTVRFGPQATPKADAPNVTPTSGVTRSSFGTVSGQNVEIFTLRNAHGVEVKATSYGAIITSIVTPDRNGRPGDIVLGFDTIEGYLKDSPYFGAVVGRYGNRIAKGRFTLDGHTYTLAINNGPNHLHGGLKGFDKVDVEGGVASTARRAWHSRAGARTGKKGIRATSTFGSPTS